MSEETPRVCVVRKKDARFKTMSQIWANCNSEGVTIPQEVTDYFRDGHPDGSLVEQLAILPKLSGEELFFEVELDDSRLETASSIRFYLSDVGPPTKITGEKMHKECFRAFLLGLNIVTKDGPIPKTSALNWQRLYKDRDIIFLTDCCNSEVTDWRMCQTCKKVFHWVRFDASKCDSK